MAKSALLSELLRRFNRYGVSPWKIEKDLSGIACAKTLYNYMNGDTKPRASIYNPLLKGIKEKYPILYKCFLCEIKEEYSDITFMDILNKMAHKDAHQ